MDPPLISPPVSTIRFDFALLFPHFYLVTDKLFHSILTYGIMMMCPSTFIAALGSAGRSVRVALVLCR